MKKGRIIFFPLKHFPSYLTLEELAHMRDKFEILMQQIDYEEQHNHYQRQLRKQIFHNKMREQFKIIKGGLS